MRDKHPVKITNGTDLNNLHNKLFVYLLGEALAQVRMKALHYSLQLKEK